MKNHYQTKRRAVESYFTPANRLENSSSTHVSPCGQYELETCEYATTTKTWKYSRGVVIRSSDGTMLADIKRNIASFWHCWVTHPNGRDYLLCGEDYQGYSVLNLTDGHSVVHFPNSGIKGCGFCWTSVEPSPDRLVLAVTGCYWANPYELVIFDFAQPEQLPIPELARFENLGTTTGWLDNHRFVLSQDIHYRKSDGRPYNRLSENERDLVDADDSLGGYRSETIEYVRPQTPRSE